MIYSISGLYGLLVLYGGLADPPDRIVDWEKGKGDDDDETKKHGLLKIRSRRTYPIPSHPIHPPRLIFFSIAKGQARRPFQLQTIFHPPEIPNPSNSVTPFQQTPSKSKASVCWEKDTSTNHGLPS
jgi:hypothetical protein